MKKTVEGRIFTNTRKSLPIQELKDFFRNNVTIIGVHVTLLGDYHVAATWDCRDIHYLFN